MEKQDKQTPKEMLFRVIKVAEIIAKAMDTTNIPVSTNGIFNASEPKELFQPMEQNTQK